MMTQTSAADEPLYSPLSEDPDLRDIVEMFVDEMPDRTARFVERLNASDWEGLRRLSHQLKGAAGSYGFRPITDLAAEVEQAVRTSCPEEKIRQLVDDLVSLCGRAQAGP